MPSNSEIQSIIDREIDNHIANGHNEMLEISPTDPAYGTPSQERVELIDWILEYKIPDSYPDENWKNRILVEIREVVEIAIEELEYSGELYGNGKLNEIGLFTYFNERLAWYRKLTPDEYSSLEIFPVNLTHSNGKTFTWCGQMWQEGQAGARLNWLGFYNEHELTRQFCSTGCYWPINENPPEKLILAWAKELLKKSQKVNFKKIAKSIEDNNGDKTPRKVRSNK